MMMAASGWTLLGTLFFVAILGPWGSLLGAPWMGLVILAQRWR